MTYPLTTDALDDRLGFIGTAGAGKTYSAGTAVERLLETDARVVIVDPLDVWWGLRLNADASPSKHNVVIFGGEHGDLPLTEQAGKLIGETVASMGESCIVSLGSLPTKAAERRFMLPFLEAVYAKASGDPVHFVFDEADMWAPQTANEKGDQIKILGMMETIVRRGRVKGFIPWLITQRPAVLNKNVLSQVDGLAAFKLTSSQDREAIGGWIRANADEGQWPRLNASLPTMERGQGIVWVPGRGILETVQFPAKATFDSSRTPKRGERRQQRDLKPLNLESLKAKLASIEQETKATDPRALQAEVARLTKALNTALKAIKEPVAPPPVVANADELATARADGEHIGFDAGVAAARQAIDALRPGKRAPAPVAARVERQARPVAVSVARSSTTGSLPPGERAVLIAALQFEGVERDQLSVLTGYKRSSRDAYIQRLREKGLVQVTGQTVTALEGAIETLGADYQPLPTGFELQSYWMSKLPTGEAAVLSVLIDHHPEGVDRHIIDGITGYKRSSRDAYIQRLKAKRLVEISGQEIAASDRLFS